MEHSFISLWCKLLYLKIQVWSISFISICSWNAVRQHEEYFCPLKRNHGAGVITSGPGQMTHCYCSHLQPEPDTTKDHARHCKRKHFVNGCVICNTRCDSYVLIESWGNDAGYQWVESLQIHSLRLDHKCAITTKASFEQSKQLLLLRRMVIWHGQHQLDHNSFTSALDIWHSIALEKVKGVLFTPFYTW